MQNKLKRWEAALMVGIAAALLMGAVLEQEHNDLAQRVIRLHVIANSDSEADQSLKLLVRDRILDSAADLYHPDDDMTSACERLSGQLDTLKRVGEQALREQGCPHPVQVTLGSCDFPTKQYHDFALPAGEYTALRVVIGEGKGENWWCVAFPPLCLGSVTETVDQAAQVGRFTQSQVSLITGESEGYVVKFKALELWDKFKSLF
ncbi:MAG: stage II sporulation protein R [Oscillospiraceae bacterium]|nr:stage II sporulation protein R [Oscillospiraceae bacterium]